MSNYRSKLFLAGSLGLKLIHHCGFFGQIRYKSSQEESNDGFCLRTIL